MFDLDSGGNLAIDGGLTLGSTVQGTSSHMFAVLGSNQGSITSGTDVVFDTDRGSQGVTLNASTGVFSLQANKTYVLEAALYFQYSAASTNQYGWVDSSNTALTGGTDGTGLTPTSGSQESSQTTAKAIITTSARTDVHLRVSATAQTGTIAADRSYAHIVEVGTTDATLFSDQRLKNDITPLSSISDDLARLQPVLFNWRSEEYPHLNLGSGMQLGLIAQDVEEVLPSLVTQGEDGFKRVNYEHIPMLLLQGIKEQQARIETLEMQNEALTRLVCRDYSDSQVCHGVSGLGGIDVLSGHDQVGGPALWVYGSIATALAALGAVFLVTSRRRSETRA